MEKVLKMLYRAFGKTGIELSALGFGTNRFSLRDINDETGIYESADLICKALDLGVNYIDSAYTYSLKRAEDIICIAMKNTDKKCHLTVKVSNYEDKTSYGALKRIESSLSKMDVDRVTFCYMWAIKSYDEFREVVKSGGIYEGALEAKKLGLIDHICFSTHADSRDIVKIIDEDIFDGVIISYNLLNYMYMDKVLYAAGKRNIGVITMNSLGGGIIPQNSSYFETIKMNDYETLSQAALKFIYSHNEITTVLSGMSSINYLIENVNSFKSMEDLGLQRINHVKYSIKQLDSFCTSCSYCEGCPKSIPISKFMKGYNNLYFNDNSPIYNRHNSEIIKNIKMFKSIRASLDELPDNSENPCINCLQCEKKCTQKLPITERLSEIYKLMKNCCFSKEDQKMRLYELIKSKNYAKVGFYPSGRYTKMIIDLYRDFFGDIEFTPFIFDSDSKAWGTKNNGIDVFPPSDIEIIRPDCIIISNYIHSEEIYSVIKNYERMGIKIVKLHEENDVPWTYQ